MSKPLTPKDLDQGTGLEIPSFVIDSVNELITFSHTFTQDELIHTILKHAPSGTTRQDVFNNRWLEIEKCYRAAGWHVEYDKPGYNEDYPARFIFRPK